MRNQVIQGREVYAKDAIKFYYKLAKINGLISELLEFSGLKNEDSLRWSYNNGRISIEQINAYKYVLGADEKYLTGEMELTDEIKAKEMKRAKGMKVNEISNKGGFKEENKDMKASCIVNFYKNKILNCKGSSERNIIKHDLDKFNKEINNGIQQLEKLISALNAIE